MEDPFFEQRPEQLGWEVYVRLTQEWQGGSMNEEL
jgi:hypothetical protein